jgi:hypothetical protein
MGMKRVKIFLHEPFINRLIGSELNLLLNDKANTVDAINEVDRLIKNSGSFPLPDYRSLRARTHAVSLVPNYATIYDTSPFGSCNPQKSFKTCENLT